MRAIEWTGESVRLIDQTRLPNEVVWIECRTTEEVAEAIEALRVRGAPAIGVAAGYALALAALNSSARDRDGWRSDLDRAAARLRQTRPTAVSLFRALDHVLQAADAADSVADGQRRVLAASEALAHQDRRVNEQIGLHGAALIPARAHILTHCNTGALATVEHGTALGIIRTAHRQGKQIHVWVDETRPALQGARLTAWELLAAGIPHTIIVDGLAAFLMRRGEIDLVIVGADRIAANGDVANKVGTYSLAVLARAHGLPFYVAAPLSTVDPQIERGVDIPLEERSPDEVRTIRGIPVAPAASPALNLAFDVTPAELVTAIVTEAGIARAPYNRSLAELAAAAVHEESVSRP
ncbi:MAG: S-methyl-5-thioribose-1-phosphate isomerase [Chloroflexi bacterium]|nr:S-methyl-5-thioribose-1-phosphate isomerase [Chloroflexota bacterium]